MTSFCRIILRTAAVLVHLSGRLPVARPMATSSRCCEPSPSMNAVAPSLPQTADDAPPPEKTVSSMASALSLTSSAVQLRPRTFPARSPWHLPTYLQDRTNSYGLQRLTDLFSAPTPPSADSRGKLSCENAPAKARVLLLGRIYTRC